MRGLYFCRFLQANRYASFKGVSADDTDNGQPREVLVKEKGDPNNLELARKWLKQCHVDKKMNSKEWKFKWFLGFRDVTGATNERTLIAFIIPYCGISYTINIIFTVSIRSSLLLLANLNTFTCDYISRQKVGGQHLTLSILKQLPVLPPDRYTPDLIDFIVPRVVELSYTAWDLQSFAQDILSEVGQETWDRWFKDAPIHTSPPPEGQPTHPAPFVWDEERRFRMRAELDALLFHLYGLTREEADYIMETFPIVKRKDKAKYGEYRTKRVILKYYDDMIGKFDFDEKDGVEAGGERGEGGT